MKVKTSELEGAALDWAVAMAVEVWKDAHEWFPTMTLDPSFSGVQPMVYSDGQAFCQLIPNNPFRQDYQIYRPSTDWSQGGPLIDENWGKAVSELIKMASQAKSKLKWNAFIHIDKSATKLQWFMRAIVAAKLGDEVDVPEELL